MRWCWLACFNPLAGIRCFLTALIWGMANSRMRAFQSPSGDSLFSDVSFETLVANIKAGWQVSIP